MTPPPLFDAGLARRRLARAHRIGYADFLMRRVVDDLDDRLGAVLRTSPPPSTSRRPRRSRRKPCAAAGGGSGGVLRLYPSRSPGAAVADPEALPVPAQSFDLAVSLLALQHVNDLPGTLAQLRRALRPDGPVSSAASSAGGRLTELRQAFVEAESEVEGGISPRVAPFAE